jgi:hypothetical protein
VRGVGSGQSETAVVVSWRWRSAFSFLISSLFSEELTSWDGLPKGDDIVEKSMCMTNEKS